VLNWYPSCVLDSLNSIVMLNTVNSPMDICACLILYGFIWLSVPLCLHYCPNHCPIPARIHFIHAFPTSNEHWPSNASNGENLQLTNMASGYRQVILREIFKASHSPYGLLEHILMPFELCKTATLQRLYRATLLFPCGSGVFRIGPR